MSSAAGRRPPVVFARHWGTVLVLTGRAVPVASWALTGLGRPDLAVVDDLARLQLGARRLGYSIRVPDACPELVDLLGLVGLATLTMSVAATATADAALAGALQVDGEREDLEQVGVEEAVEPDDPVA
jgi:hypothetical protein